ncbi:MAG TPA: hypothetical protein VEL28_08155 [Candidatus Binatia bacterium]|nr:hypothetical protein [Candidatus Binatia bacterium]
MANLKLRFSVLVMIVAVAVRLLAWQEASSSPLVHLERWPASEMNLMHRWAQQVAAGDFLLRRSVVPDLGYLVCTRKELSARPAGACGGDVVAERTRAWLEPAELWQQPLYPYLVGAVYAAAGSSDARIVLLAQAGLGVLASLLAMAVATRMFGAASGIGAGVIAALAGSAIHHEMLLVQSSVAGFAVLLSLCAVLRAVAVPASLPRAFVAGASAGALVLLSLSALLFVAAALTWSMLAVRRASAADARSPAMLFGAVFTAGILMVVAPLMVRNVSVGLAPLGWPPAASLAFIHGNAPGAGIRGLVRSPDAPAIVAEAGLEPHGVVRATLARYQSPGPWAQLLAAKLAAFGHWYEAASDSNYAYFQRLLPATAHMTLSWSALLGLAAMGAAFSLRTAPALLLPVAWAATTAMVYVAFVPSARDRLPAALALAPLAGHGAALLAAWLRQRDLWRLATGAALAAGVAALSMAPWEASFGLIRTDFYNVTNRIALELTGEAMARGDAGAALAITEKQLRAEPDSLREVPAGAELGLDAWVATAAGGFASIYRRAADLLAAAGNEEVAAQRAARAEVLETVAREWKNAPRKMPPAAEPPAGGPSPAAASPPAAPTVTRTPPGEAKSPGGAAAAH